MEIRHLRYFLAVAEAGHITGAAEQLGMQQPPLSRLISSMESELNARLFVRKPRGVELTDAGLVFRDRARRVLVELDQAVETTRSTARGEQGRICVGVTPTGPFHPLVSRVMREFREVFPLVTFTLDERLSGELIDHVRSGKVDAAFVWTSRVDGLNRLALLDDELVVALPTGHELAREDRGRDEPLAVTSLAGETFIVYGRRDGFGLFAATIVACRTAGFSPHFGQEAPRLASALNLVAAGLGVFFVPSCIRCIHIDGVEFRRLKAQPQPKSTLNLISRRGEGSAAVRNFINLVRDAARKYTAPRPPI